MEDKFEYVGKDKLGRNVRVYFETEPKIDKKTCFCSGTLQINDNYYVNFDLRLNSINPNDSNEIYIGMLIGGKTSEPLQLHYGTILMIALFEYVCFLEKKLDITIDEIFGDLNADDKKAYIEKTNGRRRLVNFYEDVIKYLPSDINKKITIAFYGGDPKNPLDSKDVEHACWFRYFITNKEEDT